jgi:hypothetical protein
MFSRSKLLTEVVNCRQSGSEIPGGVELPPLSIDVVAMLWKMEDGINVVCYI